MLILTAGAALIVDSVECLGVWLHLLPNSTPNDGVPATSKTPCCERPSAHTAQGPFSVPFLSHCCRCLPLYSFDPHISALPVYKGCVLETSRRTGNGIFSDEPTSLLFLQSCAQAFTLFLEATCPGGQKTTQIVSWKTLYLCMSSQCCVPSRCFYLLHSANSCRYCFAWKHFPLPPPLPNYLCSTTHPSLWNNNRTWILECLHWDASPLGAN